MTAVVINNTTTTTTVSADGDGNNAHPHNHRDNKYSPFAAYCVLLAKRFSL